MTKYIIVLPDGTEISSGADTTNAIASIQLTTATNSGVELTLGSVCAAMVEASLITPAAGVSITAGEEITLYTAEDDGTRNKVGLFTVEKPTHPSANRTKLTAYDRVTRLDKDLTEWLGGLTGWPYTIKTLAEMICAECGVALATTDFPNSSYQIIAKPTANTVTGRQLMQWIAEIAGRFVTANANGKLAFEWYTESGITITPDGDNYYFADSLTYDEYSVMPVDAVKLRLADSDDGALWPAGEAQNPYIVLGNKLLVLDATSANMSILSQMLAAAMISYTPCKVTVPASCGVKAGQIITITDSNGTTIKTLAMQVVQSGQRLTLESSGSAKRSSSENLNNMTEQDYKNYADSAATGAVNAQTQEEVFNRLTNSGETQGIYLKDGKLYLNASFIGTGFMSADIIRAGYIRSTDYQLTEYVLIYPEDNTYPSDSLFPSNGEQIVKGFEIDFEHGIIRGVFWSEITDSLQTQVDELKDQVDALKNRTTTLENRATALEAWAIEVDDQANDFEARITKLENALVYPKSL